VFDTELSSPLDYSRKQVLAWLHEYLGVPPSEHCFRISMLVPKLRENGWRWELYEASNTKKWHFLVSKALERRYYNIMLVEFLDGGMQGESSNTGVVEDNLEAANAEQTYVSDPQAVQNMIEDGEAESVVCVFVIPAMYLVV